MAFSGESASIESRIGELLDGNKKYQGTHQIPRKFEEIKIMPNRPPAIAIVTCADPRVIPEQYFDIKPGTGYLVMRNAGGHAPEALRSIALLDLEFDICAVLIVHHTDCGMTHMQESKARKSLKERVGDDKEKLAAIDALDLGAIPNADFEASLKKDVEIVKKSKWFKDEMLVKGMLYDLDKGEVREIVG